MSSFQDRFQGVWSETYIKKLLFKLAMVFIILGALNWLFMGLFDMNMVSSILGKGVIAHSIYIIIGISALFVMFDRDTYLPFLGPMVAPCSVLENKEPPGATKEVKVMITPNTKIIYWAAEPASEGLKSIQSWKEAYGKYDNAGVATSNAEGVALIKVRDPQAYKVPLKGRLESHIHYRTCGEAGWLGTVRTIFIDHKGPEGFESPMKKYRVTELADTAASIY